MTRTTTLCLLAMITSACATAPQDKSPYSLQHPDGIVIYENSHCFRGCAGYTLMIFADGKASYFAKSGKNDFDFKIKSSKMHEIAAALNTLEDPLVSCPPVVGTDLGHTILTVKRNDTERKVDHYHGCHASKSLSDFETMMNDIGASALAAHTPNHSHE